MHLKIHTLSAVYISKIFSGGMGIVNHGVAQYIYTQQDLSFWFCLFVCFLIVLS